jgi:hypothetical protein
VHSLETPLTTHGTHDGTGAGDHDHPYRFGRRPRASATYPFSTRQYVRLLLLRSRIGLLGVECMVEREPTGETGVRACLPLPQAEHEEN